MVHQSVGSGSVTTTTVQRSRCLIAAGAFGPDLESSRSAGEPLYAAFVLILVLGLRMGEVLGLTWELVDFDAAELYVGEQVQRVGRQLLRRQVKTETSEAPLPMSSIVALAS